MTENSVPTDLREILDWLRREGFRDLDGRFGPDFGDRILTMVRDSEQVRFVRDRAQWFVEVADPAGALAHGH